MTSRFHQWIGCLVSLLAAASLSGASPVSKTKAAALRATKQSEEIAQHIDVLLKQRLKPDSLPRVIPNPFVVVSGTVSAQHTDDSIPDASVEASARPLAETTGVQAGEFPALTSAEILARCAASLKFGGMIQLNDRVQVVINNVPRKEGDVVFVTLGAAKVYLRVLRITPGAVTLRLNEAEQVVPF
ncbi:MAG: hypothetical protein JWM88_1283 [Verrucomicrobia bacterium]|nr:hypothetical protein [Verrucomicrobiota bacterium]